MVAIEKNMLVKYKYSLFLLYIKITSCFVIISYSYLTIFLISNDIEKVNLFLPYMIYFYDSKILYSMHQNLTC